MKTHTCHICGGDIYPGQSFSRSRKGKRHLLPDCTHAKSLISQEPTPEPPEDAKFLNLSLPRLLGSSVHVSEVERQCDYCDNYDLSFILSGDEYERQVWKIAVGEFWENRSRIVVRLMHYPQCPIPFDDGYQAEARGELILMKRKPISSPYRGFRRAA